MPNSPDNILPASPMSNNVASQNNINKPVDFNSDHWLQFNINQSLSTPEGKQWIENTMKNFQDIKQKIQENHIDPHTKIMQDKFKDSPHTLALNTNDEPLVAKKWYPINPPPVSNSPAEKKS